ncbi:MAG: PA domain-containing protein [Dehalococcoidia bacterium]
MKLAGTASWPAVAVICLAAGALLVACNGQSKPPTPSIPPASASVTPVAASSTPAGAVSPASRQSQPATDTGTVPPSPVDATAHGSPRAPSATPPPPRVTITPLGQNDLGNSGFNANVVAHNGYAYVGSWGYGANCPNHGVRIVDLSDPAQPAVVGAIAQIRGTTQEDVKVRHINTSAFTGDLLATGIQRCDRTGAGGIDLYDVSDPRNPRQLSFFPTGVARGVHELDLIQQGDRALALLAVPASELDGGDGDFRIIDVSDPRHPVQIAQWGARAQLGVDLKSGIGCQRQIFDHSARASADGRRVYLSYWDAGVIVLDISDPTAPKLVGRIQYPPGEEGETHSVAETADGQHLLVADESGIFGGPYGLHFRVDAPDGPHAVYGCESLFSRPLTETGVISGDVVAVGSGCPGAAFAQNPAGKVALLDAGSCTAGEQAARLAGAGATAMIVATVSADGEPESLSSGKTVNIPVVSIRPADADRLRASLNGASASIVLPSERHSGGLRIWDISNLANPRQVGAYQTPDSTAFPPPDTGFYTIHNPEVVGDLAYLSWYTDGLRVVDVSDPTNPRELAAYVPPAGKNPLRSEFPDQTLDWGVSVQGGLVLLSDINTGLHVVRVDVQR